MKKYLTALLIFCSSLASANAELLIKQLNQLGLSDVEIKNSPLNGVKTAVTNNGIFYITDDGKYILEGKLYEISAQGVRDVSTTLLLDKLNSYKNEMVIYPAKKEKFVVTVFMDSTCHYCQILHKQIKEYNSLGITVRYLAFPRAGLQSKTASEMEAVFSAKDPQFALSEMMKGNPPKTLKTPNVVKKHYQLGLQFNVSGTPTIITEQGRIIGGYLKPADLFAELSQ